MSRYLKLSAVAVLALISMATVASARPRVVVGGYIGPRPVYGPAWYGPRIGATAFPRGAITGSVKIETKMKDAAVFVDGGFAGTVGQLKTFHLRPGSHRIELRNQGRTFYQERINVIPNKTLKIVPNFR